MSSLDQAFVKAFARRQQPDRDDAPISHALAHPPTPADPGPSVSARPPAAAIEPPAEVSTAVPEFDDQRRDDGVLQVNPSVAGSTMVWVDEVADQHLRADAAAFPPIPKPQFVERPDRGSPPQPVAVGPPSGYFHASSDQGSAGQGSAGLAPERSEQTRERSEQAGVTAPDRLRTATVDRLPWAPSTLRVDPPHVIESAERVAAATDSQPKFQAVWEVDAFDLPATVVELFVSGGIADDLSRRMSGAVEQGLRSVLLTSVQPTEGRSTVAVGIAVSVAAAGYRVALIDADATHPTLADDLRLDVEYGWIDALRGGLPVEEVAVHSLRDGVTLIPLMPPNGDTAATAGEIETLVDRAKKRFDLVIVDGPAGAAGVTTQSRAFDTALIVRNVHETKPEEINALSYLLRERGIQGIGVVENFAGR